MDGCRDLGFKGGLVLHSSFVRGTGAFVARAGNPAGLADRRAITRGCVVVRLLATSDQFLVEVGLVIRAGRYEYSAERRGINAGNAVPVPDMPPLIVCLRSPA